MEVSERRDMVRAVDRKDGDASVRMLRQAARRFDEARRAVLRPAMEAKPRELPVLVPRRALAYSLPKQEGEDDEAWRSPDASLFGRRKVEERLSLIREDLRGSLRESRLSRQPTL
jgi:hypothetical protein